MKYSRENWLALFNRRLKLPNFYSWVEKVREREKELIGDVGIDEVIRNGEKIGEIILNEDLEGKFN